MNHQNKKFNISRNYIFIIASIIFITMAIFMWSYSIDDAFITFRYAEHLADGHGLVFNVTDEPVEGYSNFLWLLILSVLYKIGFGTYLTSKILGLLSFYLAAFVWYENFKDDKKSNLWMSSILFLIFPVTILWGVSGLELGLHTLILTLILTSVFNKSKYIYIWLPFLVISRPEGPAIAMVIIISDFFVNWRKRNIDWKYTLTALSIIIVTTVGLVLFRLSYFGYPLPNTYYAKVHHILINGLKINAQMLIYISPFLLALLASIVYIIKRKFTNKLLVVMTAIFITQLVISSRIDPVMNFQFRYLIPVFIPLISIALMVISTLKKKNTKNLLLVIVSINLLITLPQIIDRIKIEKDIWGSQQAFISLVEDFPQKTTISMTDMGRIPYYADKTYYDIWGLLNKEIATGKFNNITELSRQPDYFVFIGYIHTKAPRLKFYREQLIAYNQVFSETYKISYVCNPPDQDVTTPGYNYLVFKRMTEPLNTEEIINRFKDGKARLK